MPRVSIGLPVYNGERFLEEALASLLSQTYTDFELIISDNASTDRTQDICVAAVARDGRVRYHRNAVNLGAGRNYNITFELARGEFFKWAAHDDVCAPRFLEACVSALDAHPEAVVVFPKMMDIDEHGTRLPERMSSHLSRAERGASAKPYLRFWNLMRTDYTVEEIFGLIRRDILARSALIKNYTDSDRTLLAQLGLYGTIHEVQEVLFFHRMHSGMSTQTHKDWKARTAWFDPSLTGRIVFPPWRQAREYILAVLRSPVSLFEKGRCTGLVFYWMVKHRQLLLGDLRKGINLIVNKVTRRAAPASVAATTGKT